MRTIPEAVANLERLGISCFDAFAIRRIAMTLHRWAELECGDDHGCIERDDQSQKPYFRSSRTMKRWPVADREGGALKRLAEIMKTYPKLATYQQTDPRGASLYILRPGDVPEGAEVASYYSRGIAVYK